MNMIKRLFVTDSESASALILRVGLGSVIFAHGAQKLFGWFGGYGFDATMNFLTNDGHLPWLIAFLVIAFESIGAISLVIGFCTRIMAFGIAAIMIGAIALVHWNNGFFMDWMGTMNTEGFEYHLLALTLSLGLMVTGGGMWSIDSLFNRKDWSVSDDDKYKVEVRKEKRVEVGA
jgi:putative oxidoreductase